MRIAVCGDVHISKTSSIVRGRGSKYSDRIENCIESINWFEQLALNNGCEMVVYLGDFFDKPILDDEVITSIKDIKWSCLEHYFIVGNHESSVNGLAYSSLKVLEDKGREFNVISSSMEMTVGNTHIGFLPYVIETDRKPLNEYFSKMPSIIFSHNDIKGIQMGMMTSTVGFDINEIEDDINLNLFMNGHLHNGNQLSSKIINLGNLTGQNFGEDGFTYKHNVAIIDTDTKDISTVENPYALYFYKIDAWSYDDFVETLSDIRPSGAVLSIKCKGIDVDNIKNLIKKVPNIKYYKLNASYSSFESDEKSEELSFNIDYLEELKKFCLENIGNNDIVLEELQEVCK